MCNSVQPCPEEPPDDICEALRRIIETLVNRDKRLHGNSGTHGLAHRFREQIEGENGPGTRVWDTHDQQFRDQQRGLRRRLEEYQRNRCGPPPPGAWRWATRPAPQPQEWRGPPTSTREIVTVVGGGAAAIGAGYLIYRAVRMIPSLFPPLWPTIPANAAIP